MLHALSADVIGAIASGTKGFIVDCLEWDKLSLLWSSVHHGLRNDPDSVAVRQVLEKQFFLDCCFLPKVLLFLLRVVLLT